jgi:hypothetical protein
LVNEQAAQAFRALAATSRESGKSKCAGRAYAARIVPALRPLQDVRAECLQHRHIAGVTAAGGWNAVDASFIMPGIVGTPSFAEVEFEPHSKSIGGGISSACEGVCSVAASGLAEQCGVRFTHVLQTEWLRSIACCGPRIET